MKRCGFMNIDEIIEGYADRLSKDKGLDIIINDRYSLLKNGKINNSCGIINGWHNNPYCLKIKSNKSLWNRCVYLKQFRDKKLVESPLANWHVCYCGVAEYVIPVVFNKILIAEIAVTGFKGELSSRMADVLSKRINVKKYELLSDFNNLLEIKNNTAEMLNSYLLPIKELILKIASEKQKEGAFLILDAKNPSLQYVTMALDFINNNFKKSITAFDVAKHCNLSLSYLQHLFSQHHIRGVFGEILFKRIETACYMLKNTSCSVKEIALNCGFNNVDYFSVAFKKQCGIPPLKYRKS